MKRIALILTICLLVAVAAQAQEDYDILITRVDQAWEDRGANTSPMKEALKKAEQAYGIKPGFDAAWRAARTCFWICDRTDNEKTDLEYGKRGVEWAEKAIKYKPDSVEAYYYYTLCIGEYGKGMSIVTALAKGLGGDFEKGAKKAIALDASYEKGAPDRAFGRYYFKLPWPKYSAKKAEAHFKKSLAIAPKHARTLAYLAELYIKEKQYDKAKETLNFLLNLKAGYPDQAFDHKYYQGIGKDLMDQIKDK